MSALSLVVGEKTVALPSQWTTVSVHPKDREEFVAVVRDLASAPGASEPETGLSVLCATVGFDDDALEVTVYAAQDMKSAARAVLPGADVLDAAIAEAVSS